MIPVILSGGSGTRLWPLSRRAYPKQFLKLLGDRSLLQQTVLRLSADAFRPPLILGNHEHRFLVAEQLQETGVTPEAIVLEPCGRNTAPAACVAALMAEDRVDDLVLLLPSDHIIPDREAFAKTIARGIDAASAGAFVTFGVKPTRPHTGYGYIETGREAQVTGALPVRRFVEKPDSQTAQAYIDSGNYFWNAGIFLFSPRSMINAFAAHAPAILGACRQALEKAGRDLDFLRLDEKAYRQCPSISLDYAIMEKTDNIVCVPFDTAWSDLGTWPSVWEMNDKDAAGNAVRGNVIIQDTINSLAHSEDGACLTLIGLKNVIAIATRDAILVAARESAQDVRRIVGHLQDRGQDEAVRHKRVYRPWGWYEELDHGQRYLVKSLMVKPGGMLSLQVHEKRSEHWVVVSGSVSVTIGDTTRTLNENESAYIPVHARHRLHNPGNSPALLIEVQSGNYLSEDDIVRFDDIYGREKRPLPS